jgi:cytosine/adenosine deaminase-related metal-dependent hydrolase
VNESDIAVLKARGVGVSHNPESNMKLASGIAPVKAYLAADVAIGLGTDGACQQQRSRHVRSDARRLIPAESRDV